jgi:membrane protease YdiL (CAAX protease family)
VIFSILVTVVAWAAPLLGGGPRSPGMGFILWGIAPLLVSLLLRVWMRDWSDLGMRPAIKEHARWYLLSVFALPMMMGLTLLTGMLLSVVSVSEFSLGRYLQTALTALPIFLIFAIFEEVGWRGYLAPKLASLGINRYLAAALVAVVWGSWHLPYISELTWVYTAEDLSSFIPRYYLVCFALSIVYGEIRRSTASFWPAVLLHGVANAFGHPLAAGYVTIVAGNEYLASISTGLILIAFVLVLGGAIGRWRMHTPR